MSRQNRLYRSATKTGNKIVKKERNLQKLYHDFERKSEILRKDYNTTVNPPDSPLYRPRTARVGRPHDLEGLVRDDSSAPAATRAASRTAKLTTRDYGMTAMWLVDETQVEINHKTHEVQELKDLIKEQLNLGNDDLANYYGERIVNIKQEVQSLNYDLAAYKAMVHEIGVQDRYSVESFNGVDKKTAIDSLTQFIANQKDESYAESQRHLQTALTQKYRTKSVATRYDARTKMQQVPSTKEGKSIVNQIKLEIKNQQGEGFARSKRLEKIKERTQNANIGVNVVQE